MPRLLCRRTLILPVCAALLAGSLVGFAAGKESDRPAPLVAAGEIGRSALPPGSTERSRDGLEASALRLAAALDAVPVRADGEESTRYCTADRLRVRWSAPRDGEFAVGGHLDPVGPAPDDEAAHANGIVVCESASYAYMGFEARWVDERWQVASVPALSDEHDLEEAHEEEAHEEEAHEEPAQEEAHERGTSEEAVHEHRTHEHGTHEHAAAPARTTAPAGSAARGFSVPPVSGIDRYAAYDPQRVCDPVAKPGTLALRDLLLRTYPGTRSLGISRTCTARGVSEHKEGRAFDWGVNVGVPAERAAAESVMSQLLATDAAGHRHALARRLGVMYMIWDRKIWSSYSADGGWRPYSGANAHTDHVHLSLSWDGAMGRTSYWQGANAELLQVDPELRLVEGPGGSGGPAPAPATGGGSAAKGDPVRREQDEQRAARLHHERGREHQKKIAARAPAPDADASDEPAGGQGSAPAPIVAAAPKRTGTQPAPVRAVKTQAAGPARAQRTAPARKATQQVARPKKAVAVRQPAPKKAVQVKTAAVTASAPKKPVAKKAPRAVAPKKAAPKKAAPKQVTAKTTAPKKAVREKVERSPAAGTAPKGKGGRG